MHSQAIEMKKNKSTIKHNKKNISKAEELTNALNLLLADEFSLFTKTLNFHWNIVGPRFYSLHSFLEKQYHDLLIIMDDVAERIRMLGGRPNGSLKSFEKLSQIEDIKQKSLSSEQMLSQLLEDHQVVSSFIRNLLDKNKDLESDPGTEDFLISILRKHEETCWMLKSQLQ